MSESNLKIDLTRIHYSQCWEDADVLLEALDIQPGDRCLSIASAGDNALAMLVRQPEKVIAIDANPAQLHCLELKVAAFKSLRYDEMLELVGSRPSDRRIALYDSCRAAMSRDARRYWDARQDAIDEGFGNTGKLERFFKIFRRAILPLTHSRADVNRLFEPRSLEERVRFHDEKWNNRRWRWLFRVFFSRFVISRLGREASFFDYAEGSVADRIMERARFAMVDLAPAENPYLQGILLGRYATCEPLAFREAHFETIKSNLHRLEWRLCSLESYCRSIEESSVDRFNLSDVFEYVSEEASHELLDELTRVAKPNGRLVYWNMLVPRSRPESMKDRLRPMEELSDRLYREDKAFLYSRFVIEEVTK